MPPENTGARRFTPGLSLALFRSLSAMLRPHSVLVAVVFLTLGGCAERSGSEGAVAEVAPAVLAPWAEDAPRARVLLLGTFHFADAGLDGYVPRFAVDVRSPERQREVEDAVDRLAAFRPTKVAVEQRPDQQARLDSLYRAYLAGDYELGANEVYQVGFRLARRLGHDRVWAVDAPNRTYFPEWTDADWDAEVARRPPVDSTWDARYGALYAHRDSLKTTRPLRETWLETNDPARLREHLGHYLVGSFGMSEGPSDYFGADVATYWWNRNLRMFQNLQRITPSPEDRVVLVVGAGHVPILRHLVEASPEHDLVDLSEVLR